MKNEFTEVMSKRSDDDLIKIVTAERDKYNQDAIAAAEAEVNSRNIDTSKFEEIKEKTTLERKAQDTVEANSVGQLTRLLHHIIDSIIWITAAMIIVSIIGFILNELIINFLPLISLFLLLGSFLAYYAIMEIKFQKTVAKFITKTKVVKLNGDKPEDSDILMRTLCRLIPFDRFTFLFMQNGIHDNLSKTKVVKDIKPN